MSKYLTFALGVLKLLTINIIVLTGKLTAPVWTPIIFPLRFYGQNAVFNFCLSKGWHIKRLEQIQHLYHEFDDRYVIDPYPAQESTGGFITKRNVGYIEAFMAYVFIYVWVDSDAHLDLTSKFIVLRDFKATQITKTSMILDGQLVDIGSKIETYGGYWLCGDAMRENKINYFSWLSFKAMYQWTCMRNGFYGFNYTVLESWLENFSTVPELWTVHVLGSNRHYDDIRNKSVRLKTDVKPDGDRWVTADLSHWGWEVTSSNIDGNPFISIMSAKIVDNGDGTYSGKGYEFGWRRFGSSVVRVFNVKATVSDFIKYNNTNFK